MIEKNEKISWIVIERADGAGKTFLSKKLYSYSRSHHKNKKFILFDESSNSKIGKLIKSIIRDKSFFKLGNNVHYPLAEALALDEDSLYPKEKGAE